MQYEDRTLPPNSYSEDSLGMRVSGNVRDGVVGGQNLVCLIVWDLNGKLLLECHDYLHSVQAVKPKVVLKVGSR